MLRVSLLIITFITLWACLPPPVEESNRALSYSDPRTLLEAVRQAAIETRSVRYRFEFGQSEAPSTWAVGETWMMQRTGISDSLIRVEGKLRTWDEEPVPFLYSTDGRSTWSVDKANKSAEIRTVGDSDRALGGSAVYGYFTEFVEKDPYWKELGQAESLRLLAPEPVGDVECHVLEVLYYSGEPRETRHIWYLGVDDLLPRGLRWFDSSTPDGGEFWLFDVRLVELSAEDFGVDEPRGFEIADHRGSPQVDPPPPEWSLTSSRGATVSSASLVGKVVVLDFWNTWCFICRALQPRMGELAERHGSREDGAKPEVLFLGVNVFEVDDADPDAYWAQLGHRYDFLRNGDEVARLYDVPWQPGVVVLGRDGRVVFSLVGGTGDRQMQIEKAIRASLE